MSKIEERRKLVQNLLDIQFNKDLEERMKKLRKHYRVDDFEEPKEKELTIEKI